MTLSHRIKQLRLNNHWTQVNLAVKLKVRQNSVAGWESGLGITLKHCRKMCKVLNIGLSDFFEGVE